MKPLSITYNANVDTLEVVGIIYKVNGSRLEDIGRIQVRKEHWEAFQRTTEPIAYFTWGFN